MCADGGLREDQELCKQQEETMRCLICHQEFCEDDDVFVAQYRGESYVVCATEKCKQILFNFLKTHVASLHAYHPTMQ